MDNIKNKIIGINNYCGLKNVFNKLNNYNYAILKGEVLSYYAYGEFGQRLSSDIDILVDKNDLKDIIRVIENNCECIKSNNKEKQIFYLLFTHQIKPIICTGSIFDINIDINFDIFWKEYEDEPICIKEFLEDVTYLEIYGQGIKTLSIIKMFVIVCLHAYKDLNSIYIIWKRKKIDISIFKDLYYLLINNIDKLSVTKVLGISKKYKIEHYVFFVIYYTNKIYNSKFLEEYINKLKTKKGEELIECYGLNPKYRRRWKIDFASRLKSKNIFKYIESDLTKEEIKSIYLNNIYI